MRRCLALASLLICALGFGAPPDPTGQWAAVVTVKDGKHSLNAVRLDGAERRTLLSDWSHISSVAWLPDRSGIVIAGRHAKEPFYSIYLLDWIIGQIRNLSLDGASMLLEYSSREKRVFFRPRYNERSDLSRVASVRLDGTGYREETSYAPPYVLIPLMGNQVRRVARGRGSFLFQFREESVVRAIDYSPESDVLLVASGLSRRFSSGRLHTAHPEMGVRQVPHAFPDLLDARLSPDGCRIAVVTERRLPKPGMPYQRKLQIVSASEASTVHLETNGGVRLFHWAAGGEWIVAVSQEIGQGDRVLEPPQPGDLVAFRHDGEAKVVLAENAVVTVLELSPPPSG